jgi:hypothetical protein
MDGFFNAIQKVETPAGVDVSLNKDHIGPYQISYAYWQDSGVPGEWQDCLADAYSRRVMLAYWERYVPEALKSDDFETLARVHYGGPNGASKASTASYWELVKKEIEEGD